MKKVIIVFLSLFALGSLLILFDSPDTGPEHATSSIDDDIKKSVVDYFQSEDSISKDAFWSSDSLLKVGVIDDMTSRNGYASYVCEVISDYGITTPTAIHVVDIVKIKLKNDWVILGKAKCN
jgi:hypothetical protein